MSNPTISQIKVGTTTYDIKDATIPFHSTEGVSHNVSEFFTAGTGGVINSDTICYFAVWGKITHLYMRGVTKNVVTVNSDYGDVTDQLLLITKSDYKYLIPTTHIYAVSHNAGYRTRYGADGQFIWAGCNRSSGYSYSAGITIPFAQCFINQGYYYD